MQTFNLVILIALGERILRPEQRPRTDADGAPLLVAGVLQFEDDPESRKRKVRPRAV